MQETPASEAVSEKVRFVTETPDLYCSDEAQAYVQRELDRPSKAWIREVVGSTRETEFVKLRTPEFVLLPDLNNPRRPQQRPFPPWSRATAAPFQQSRRSFQRPPSPAHPAPRRFNWLAIVADPGLRSVRDLRGEHLPMLERLHRQCVEAIQGEHKVGEEDIMVFANYPPSVYRLHFHFCAPFFQPSAFDAFRMHPLSAIINNLRLLSGYYALSTFQIPVHSSSDLYRALACASDYGAGDAPVSE